MSATRKARIASVILVLGASLISLGVFELKAHAIVTCLPIVPPPVDQKFGSVITAAFIISTPGGTAPLSVNAGGICDVGIYIAPTATGAKVSGSTVIDAAKVGVFNDGAIDVTIGGNTIMCTGNHNLPTVNACSTFSPNGVQTGIGTYFSCTGTGSISGNTINQYQKGGIIVRNLDNVYITNNIVTGLGPFELIAQNGIELGFSSASGDGSAEACGPTLSTSNVSHVTGNTVTGNIYTQGAEKGVISTGILGQAIARPIGPLVSALETSNRISQNQGDVILIVG